VHRAWKVHDTAQITRSRIRCSQRTRTISHLSRVVERLAAGRAPDAAYDESVCAAAHTDSGDALLSVGVGCAHALAFGKSSDIGSLPATSTSREGQTCSAPPSGAAARRCARCARAPWAPLGTGRIGALHGVTPFALESRSLSAWPPALQACVWSAFGGVFSPR